MLSADVNCNCFKLVNILDSSGVSSILPLVSETSGTFSASLSYLTPVNVTTGISTVTPPAGSVNARFALIDSRANSATYNITVSFSGTGDKLYGSLQDYVMDQDGASATFRYLNSTIGWVVEK